MFLRGANADPQRNDKLLDSSDPARPVRQPHPRPLPELRLRSESRNQPEQLRTEF